MGEISCRVIHGGTELVLATHFFKGNKMNQFDDWNPPTRLEPLPIILVAGIVLALGAVSFTSNTLRDSAHVRVHQAIHAQEVAAARALCPEGTQIKVERDGTIAGCFANNPGSKGNLPKQQKGKWVYE